MLFYIRTISEHDQTNFFIASAPDEATARSYCEGDGVTFVTEIEPLTDAHIAADYDNLALLCSV